MDAKELAAAQQTLNELDSKIKRLTAKQAVYPSDRLEAKIEGIVQERAALVAQYFPAYTNDVEAEELVGEIDNLEPLPPFDADQERENKPAKKGK